MISRIPRDFREKERGIERAFILDHECLTLVYSVKRIIRVCISKQTEDMGVKRYNDNDSNIPDRTYLELLEATLLFERDLRLLSESPRFTIPLPVMLKCRSL